MLASVKVVSLDAPRLGAEKIGHHVVANTIFVGLKISQKQIVNALEPTPFLRSKTQLRELVRQASRVVVESRNGLSNW